MGSSGRRFRPDIEGLRAVAVLAVVCYHAGVPGVGGGFTGVDVFFVVSGFLITGLLVREVADTGRVRPARFYGARARRLLPAAVLVLVATTAASAVLLPPLRAREVLLDAVASALYAGNYRLAAQGTDYLVAGAPPSPLQHFWSLGVEEQFYLLWPALLVLAVSAGRRLRATTAAGPAALALGAVAAASFAVSLRWTADSPPWAYFALPSRAWELAAGGLVALGAGRLARVPPVLAACGGWAGLALLAAGCVVLDGSTPFPGTAALAPVLGAALVVAAGDAAPRRGPAALLGLRPLRAVGRISYSWYLWHWPVLVLAPAVLGSPLGLPARLAAAGLSGLLAVATLLALENPVRFAPPLRHSGGRSLAVGGVLTAVAVAAALVALLAVPAPVGHGAAVAATHLQAGGSGAATPAEIPAAARLRALTAQVQEAVAASADAPDLPSNLTPPLAGAAQDTAAPFRQGCLLGYHAVSQPPCVYGDPAGAGTVALVGDSHAAAWQPAFEHLAEQRHQRLDVLAKTLCPALDLPIRSPYLARDYTECTAWRAGVLARLTAEHPRLVVLAVARRYGADFGFTAYDPAWLAALTRTVAALRATGAAVLVLGPVPDPRGWVPTCLSAHLSSAVACYPDRSAAVDARGIAAEDAAVTAGGGRYADVSDLFCTPRRCPLVVGADLVFRDDNHITPEYAAFLAPVIAAEVDAVAGGG